MNVNLKGIISLVVSSALAGLIVWATALGAGATQKVAISAGIAAALKDLHALWATSPKQEPVP